MEHTEFTVISPGPLGRASKGMHLQMDFTIIHHGPFRVWTEDFWFKKTVSKTTLIMIMLMISFQTI